MWRPGLLRRIIEIRQHQIFSESHAEFATVLGDSPLQRCRICRVHEQHGNAHALAVTQRFVLITIKDLIAVAIEDLEFPRFDVRAFPTRLIFPLGLSLIPSVAIGVSPLPACSPKMPMPRKLRIRRLPANATDVGQSILLRSKTSVHPTRPLRSLLLIVIDPRPVNSI